MVTIIPSLQKFSDQMNSLKIINLLEAKKYRTRDYILYDSALGSHSFCQTTIIFSLDSFIWDDFDTVSAC